MTTIFTPQPINHYVIRRHHFLVVSRIGISVRSPMTPTEHIHYLGRFGDGTDEEHKEEEIGWKNEDI